MNAKLSVVEVHLRQYPVIGARWKPGHIVRRDTETGMFEEVNSPLESRTEIVAQRALMGGGKELEDAWKRFYGEARKPYTQETYQRDAIAASWSNR